MFWTESLGGTDVVFAGAVFDFCVEDPPWRFKIIMVDWLHWLDWVSL